MSKGAIRDVFPKKSKFERKSQLWPKKSKFDQKWSTVDSTMKNAAVWENTAKYVSMGEIAQIDSRK